MRAQLITCQRTPSQHDLANIVLDSLRLHVPVVSEQVKICVLSPYRAGSTLVFNIVLALCPPSHFRVVKRHKAFGGKGFFNVTFGVVRHPLASLASFKLLTDNQANPTFEVERKRYLDSAYDIGNAHRHGYVDHLLRYEAFFGNNLELVREIATQLCLCIPTFVMPTEEHMQRIANMLEVSAIKPLTDALGPFNTVDKTTKWHGGHIGKFGGATDYRQVLSEDEIQTLNDNIIVKAFKLEFGYD